jgi:hypothetical protein
MSMESYRGQVTRAMLLSKDDHDWGLSVHHIGLCPTDILTLVNGKTFIVYIALQLKHAGKVMYIRVLPNVHLCLVPYAVIIMTNMHPCTHAHIHTKQQILHIRCGKADRMHCNSLLILKPTHKYSTILSVLSQPSFLKTGQI